MLYFLGRARKKIDELDRLIEVAKNNFRQLGGKLEEDREKAREIKESERYPVAIYSAFTVCYLTACNTYTAELTTEINLSWLWAIYIVTNKAMLTLTLIHSVVIHTASLQIKSIIINY